MTEIAQLFQTAYAFAAGLGIGFVAGMVAGWAMTIKRGGDDVWH